MAGPPDQTTWVSLLDGSLPLAGAVAFASMPACGAVLMFSGHVRSDGEDGADLLAIDYEAYVGPAVHRMRAIAKWALLQWPGLGRVAISHRVGLVPVGESSVCSASWIRAHEIGKRSATRDDHKRTTGRLGKAEG